MPNFCLEGGMKYTVGISVNGGWAEYCKVRTSLVYKIHDSVTFEQGINYSVIIILSKLQNIKFSVIVGRKKMIVDFMELVLDYLSLVLCYGFICPTVHFLVQWSLVLQYLLHH